MDTSYERNANETTKKEQEKNKQTKRTNNHCKISLKKLLNLFNYYCLVLYEYVCLVFVCDFFFFFCFYLLVIL